MNQLLSRLITTRTNTFLLVAALVWIVAYQLLVPFANMVVNFLPVDPHSHLGKSIQFFLYDTPKVLLLLTGVVFVMGVVNTYFAPERVRALLLNRGNLFANVMAAVLGAVTPFCSCSSVPLFVGFVKAGVPLSVTFSFLIASPLIDPIALALLLSLFGWKVALIFVAIGMVLSIAAGMTIGALKMERYLEDWVKNLPDVVPAGVVLPELTFADRVKAGLDSVSDVVGKVWPYVLLGIGIGAAIHGYVPQDFLLTFMGSNAWWAVPGSVLIGVPMYASPAGVLPIVEALTAKGVAMGTALAFMMSVIALSLPEMIILRKVLKIPLIATFIAVVTTGILIVGFLFNAILS